MAGMGFRLSSFVFFALAHSLCDSEFLAVCGLRNNLSFSEMSFSALLSVVLDSSETEFIINRNTFELSQTRNVYLR